MIPNMGKKIVNILAENLDRNIGREHKFESILDLAKRSGVGKSTIDRIRKGESSARIDNLDAIASAYGLDAWQFLIPDLDPRNPPSLKGEGLDQKTRDMIGLFDRLDDGQKEMMLSTMRETLKMSDHRKSRGPTAA